MRTDYYIGRTASSGWYLGGTVSWFEELSNDMEIVQLGDGLEVDFEDNNDNRGDRGGDRRANNVVVGNVGDSGFINRTFGGNFGVASLYATYLINDEWSLDWTTAIGFSGEVNSTSHTLLLNYEF